MKASRLEVKWDSLGREAVRREQGRMLHRYLKEQVLPFSTYYRELFAQEGLTADDIQSVDDLAKIPFTSKQDLLRIMDEPNGVRKLIIIPEETVLKKRPSVMARAILHGKAKLKESLAYEYRPVFLTSTTGRSAKKVSFVFTRRDMDRLASSGRRIVEVLGARPDDRLLNMFPFAPHLAFWQTYYATMTAGVFSIPTGGGKVMGTDATLRLMEMSKPDGLIGMPTFLYHLLHQAVEEGLHFPKLRTLVLGGEKVPAGMRKKLAERARELGAQNVNVLATYGFTEARMAWAQCPFPAEDEPGGYHLYPDQGIVEIVDPKTGEPVPEGSPGEIVFTPLDARGSVVMRYRTFDVISGGLVYEPCPYCGRSTPRLVGDISRSTEVKEVQFGKIKGTLVDFNELECVLDDMANIATWQIELRKIDDDPNELGEVLLHVQKIGAVDDAEVARRIEERFSAFTELRPNEIFFHSAKTMRKLQGVGVELKEKRVVDNRAEDGKPPPPPRIDGPSLSDRRGGWKGLFTRTSP